MSSRGPEPGSAGLDLLYYIVSGSVQYPARVLVGWVLVALLAAAGIAQLRVDTTTSSFLDRLHPDWDVYLESIEQFGGDEFIAIALDGAEPFDPEVLASVIDLSAALERVPGVRRVDSLSTVPSIAAEPSGRLLLDPPLMHARITESEVHRIAALVRNDRIAPRSLVSQDERTFAINVVLDGDIDGHRDQTVSMVEGIVRDFGARVSGVPVFRTAVNTQTARELVTLVPVTLVLVGIIVFFGFGSAWAAFIALSCSGLGTFVTLAAMGWSDTPVSLSTVALPPILLALGCAYTMHVLVAAQGERGGEGLRRALIQVAQPVALSGLTTAIGFLAMSTVSIAAIRDLGSFGAAGALSVLCAALTLAPALLAWKPLRADGGWLREVFAERIRAAVIGLVDARGTLVVAAWIVVGCVCAVGILRLRIETDIIEWFPLGNETRDAYEEIKDQLSGITPMNVVIESTGGELVTTPESLMAIRSLTEFVEGMPGVGRALSVADPLIQIHRGFVGSGDALPPSRAAAEQYLALLGSMAQMRDVISDDRERANVLVRADVNGSRELLEIASRIRAWWADQGPLGFDISVTGIMYEFARSEEAIAAGQLRGLSIAFAAISVILFGVFRRLGRVVAATLPNVIPLIVAFGFMGLCGITLDAATVCIGSVALGIAVDDTIHLAVGYEEQLRSGRGVSDALNGALERVVPALVMTTIAIGAGFAVLGLSEFVLIRNFGLVTCGVVVLCLMADLTLLPVLLRWSGAPAARGR